MLEKDIENLIAAHPEEFFPGEGFQLTAQQYIIGGRRIDILFEDKHGRQIIVEIKRGILTREASGQIVEYYGLLKNSNPNRNVELILCANRIPAERRTFLESIGISCKEVSIGQLTKLAEKTNYISRDDENTYQGPLLGEMAGERTDDFAQRVSQGLAPYSFKPMIPGGLHEIFLPLTDSQQEAMSKNNA